MSEHTGFHNKEHYSPDCPKCEQTKIAKSNAVGMGLIPPEQKDKCPECEGEQLVWVNHASEGYQQEDCETCRGTGQKDRLREKFITLLEDTELIPDKSLVVDKFLSLIPDIEEVKTKMKAEYTDLVDQMLKLHKKEIEEAKGKILDSIEIWATQIEEARTQGRERIGIQLRDYQKTGSVWSRELEDITRQALGE